jgi:hypothetical protein
MTKKRAVYLAVFFLFSLAAEAQINLYVGGNLQGNLSWLRGDEPTLEPGFGGGFSFVYWEYEYWFLKAGIDYNYKTSAMLDYPDDYGIEPTSPDDKVMITFTEQTLGIPLTIYFRPFERGGQYPAPCRNHADEHCPGIERGYGRIWRAGAQGIAGKGQNQDDPGHWGGLSAPAGSALVLEYSSLL